MMIRFGRTMLPLLSISMATLAASHEVAAAPIAGAPPSVLAAPAPPLEIPSLMPSARVDFASHTASFPLHVGIAPHGGLSFFIVMDTSDLRESVRLGVNWSPKLVHAKGTAAVQLGSLHLRDARDRDAQGDASGIAHFSGTVDFRPARAVVPGADLFPLADASTPGSVGDATYSPLVSGEDGVVYNAPQVANATGVHDKVVAIDWPHMRVTMRLTAGFYNGRDVLYLSTDASVPPIAALEAATYAPNLAAAPFAGDDDPSRSARLPIIPIVNGVLGAQDPNRQGLRSAAAGEGDPLNIIREEPECSDPNDPENCSALEYSPLWDVHPVVWTDAAIAAGLRHRVRAHQDVKSLFDAGQLVTGAPGGPVNDDSEIRGLRAAGIVVNCPPVFVAP